MQTKSRVIKYADLRKKIDQMDVYTFERPLTPEEEQLSKNDLENQEEIPLPKEQLQEQHIKKNTLSLSIQDLIKAHEDYTQALSKEEIEKESKKIYKEYHFNWWLLLWISLGLLFVGIIVFFALYFGGLI